MTTPLKHHRPWNPWPISIIAFFALALLACGVFITFCASHPTDLVELDYYEQEVRYQSQLDRIQRASQLAHLASITYEPAASLLKVSLPPSHPPADTVGTIHLYRPSAINLDRHITLQPNARGEQMLDTSTLQPGLWKVRLSWSANHRDYFLDQQVVVGTKAP